MTNPPIDAIREEIVTSTLVYLGPEGDLLSPSPQSCRQLRLSWGVYPTMTAPAANTDELLAAAVEACKRAGYLHNGDLAVITAGVPVGRSGTTNLLKVEVV